MWRLLLLLLVNTVTAGPFQKPRFDLNGDGSVVVSELAVVLHADYGMPSSEAEEAMLRADVDQDGLVKGGEVDALRELIDDRALARAQQFVQAYDENEDGRLSSKEFIDAAFTQGGLPFSTLQLIFRAADANGDALMDETEARRALRVVRNKEIHVAERKLQRFDADGDKTLSPTEVQILADEDMDVGREETSLAAQEADDNDDGRLGVVETADLLRILRKHAIAVAPERLKSLDKNANGQVSYEEVKIRYGKDVDPKQLKNFFKHVDINRNIVLEPEEYVSLRSLLAEELESQEEGKREQKKVISIHPRMSSEFDFLEKTRRAERVKRSEYTIYEKVNLLPLEKDWKPDRPSFVQLGDILPPEPELEKKKEDETKKEDKEVAKLNEEPHDGMQVLGVKPFKTGEEEERLDRGERREQPKEENSKNPELQSKQEKGGVEAANPREEEKFTAFKTLTPVDDDEEQKKEGQPVETDQANYKQLAVIVFKETEEDGKKEQEKEDNAKTFKEPEKNEEVEASGQEGSREDFGENEGSGQEGSGQEGSGHDSSNEEKKETKKKSKKDKKRKRSTIHQHDDMRMGDEVLAFLASTDAEIEAVDMSRRRPSSSVMKHIPSNVRERLQKTSMMQGGKKAPNFEEALIVPFDSDDFS